MRRKLACLVLSLAALACGGEPDNPYESTDDLPTEPLVGSYYELHHKVVDTSFNGGFIVGRNPAIDAELWVFDAGDAVVAKFPMRWRFNSVGLEFYTWMRNGGVLGVRGFDGKPVSSILGTYNGFQSGAAGIFGGTSFRSSNDDGVEVRVHNTATGIGVQFSIGSLRIEKGQGDQTHGWGSTIDYEREPSNW